MFGKRLCSALAFLNVGGLYTHLAGNGGPMMEFNVLACLAKFFSGHLACTISMFGEIFSFHMYDILQAHPGGKWGNIFLILWGCIWILAAILYFRQIIGKVYVMGTL